MTTDQTGPSRESVGAERFERYLTIIVAAFGLLRLKGLL